MKQNVLTLFTRTPLHVGAGSSVGAIDQPVIRERHTRFPVIPGSSLKGVLRDMVKEDKGEKEASWLFGWDKYELVNGETEEEKQQSDKKKVTTLPGIFSIGEGKILAFPVRSAKGCFAWITCPTILSRLKRDMKCQFEIMPVSNENSCMVTENSAVKFDNEVILEEYPLSIAGGTINGELISFLTSICSDDIWVNEINSKLVIVPDGLFSYFAENACEVAQHVCIDDETGVNQTGSFFNQENVPSEALFYSIITELPKEIHRQFAENAFQILANSLDNNKHLIQVGADETSGLGWCTTTLKEIENEE